MMHSRQGAILRLLLSCISAFAFLLPLAAQAQLPFTSQFVFSGNSWTLNVNDNAGTNYEVALSSIDGVSRDSFLMAGLNLPVFTHELSTKLCSLASVADDIGQEQARSIAQQQFLSLYAAASVSVSDAPLAVTVYLRDVVPTLNRQDYERYKSSLDDDYAEERKSYRRFLHGHLQDRKSLARVGKGPTDTLTARDCRTLLHDSLSSRAGLYRRKHSKVENYFASIATRKDVLKGYFAVDSVLLEIMNGSIRNMEVRGHQYLIPDRKVEGPIMTVEVVDDSTVLINGVQRMSSRPARQQFSNNFNGDTLIVQHPVVYVAQYPIPVSSMSNFGQLNSVLLVNLAEPRSDWVLPMALLMRMVPELALNSDDYSPQNGLYTIYPRGISSTQPSARLYKEDSRSLFRARVYSDFVGIQDEAPNGLIQTEISKRIIINPENLNDTWFNFWEPRLNYTKIENKQKFLPLAVAIDSAAGDTTNSQMLQVFRFSKFNIGSRINLLRFDCPKYKLSFFLNSGAYLYQTAFSDTLRTLDSAGAVLREQVDAFNGNTFSWETDMELHFLPDPRYGFGIQGTYRYMSMLSDRVQPKGNSVIGAMITGYFTPNAETENTIYFRGGIQFLPSDVDQNFLQLQLGYSVNIIR